MISAKNPGIPIRGEVSSADASAGVPYTLYDAEGNVLALSGSYQIVIESLFIFATASGAVAVTNGTDTAGSRLRRAVLPGDMGWSTVGAEIVVKKNTIPKLFAVAGQVDSQLEGRYIKLG